MTLLSAGSLNDALLATFTISISVIYLIDDGIGLVFFPGNLRNLD